MTDRQPDAMPDTFEMVAGILIFCIVIAAMIVWGGTPA